MTTMRRLVLACAAALVLIAALSAVWLQWRLAQPFTLVLHFEPVVGTEPLVLNEARYANPGGTGHFALRDFQLFISNLRLVGNDAVHVEPDSYHLLRFDGSAPGFEVALTGVPRADYRALEFGIGVDPAANASVAARGDLDPNGRMAWTWDVGYKFVLFEGALEIDGVRRPLVYHVGFSENYALLSFVLTPEQIAQREPRLAFRVDLAKLFDGASTVDMATLPTVKFDREDARELARNYATMITLKTRR
jgi:hypothetical protein